jgi:hypothetical protein
MQGRIFSYFLPLSLFASQAFADDPGVFDKGGDNPEIYFFSCYNVGEVERPSRDLVASSFDPNATLMHHHDIELMLMDLPSQSRNGAGHLLREIAAELSKVESSEYRLQLNSLSSKVRTSPGEFFGAVEYGDDLNVFWQSDFINVWHSEYKIDTEECAVRRHSISSQSKWKLSDDWMKLKLIAETMASPTSRGVVGDILELSGAVSDAVKCDSDKVYRRNECVEVTLESDIAVVNVALSASDLAAMPALQIGAMFESKECIITAPVSIDTYNFEDAITNMSSQTIIGGTLFVGELMGIDAGVSGLDMLSSSLVHDTTAGSAAHVERLEINCATQTLVPTASNMDASLGAEDAVRSDTMLEVSREIQDTQVSKSLSDLLLLVDQGALEREVALMGIRKLLVEHNTSSRIQILADFVANKKLSGDELVRLLE